MPLRPAGLLVGKRIFATSSVSVVTMVTVFLLSGLRPKISSRPSHIVTLSAVQMSGRPCVHRVCACSHSGFHNHYKGGQRSHSAFESGHLLGFSRPAAEPTTPLVFHTMQSQLKGKSLKQLPAPGLAVVSKAVFLHLGNSTRTVPGQIPALIPDPAGRVRQHRVWQCCPSAAFSA